MTDAILTDEFWGGGGLGELRKERTKKNIRFVPQTCLENKNEMGHNVLGLKN